MKSKRQNGGHDNHSSQPCNQQALPNGLISVVCIPPPLSDQQRTEKKKKDRRETVKFCVEIFGAVILFGYFSFTILIWWANKKSADAAKSAADTASATLKSSQKSSALDQRAWIAPKIVNQIFGEMKPLLVVTNFENTGKTPAIEVKTCQVAEIVENTRANIDISCPERAYSPGVATIFPGNHIERASNAVGNGGRVAIFKDGLLRKPLISPWQKTEISRAVTRHAATER
jgi:hypothetical protein